MPYSDFYEISSDIEIPNGQGITYNKFVQAINRRNNTIKDLEEEIKTIKETHISKDEVFELLQQIKDDTSELRRRSTF
jgi:DNA-binding transcriptional regulator YhcF (GntR family)